MCAHPRPVLSMRNVQTCHRRTYRMHTRTTVSMCAGGETAHRAVANATSRVWPHAGGHSTAGNMQHASTTQSPQNAHPAAAERRGGATERHAAAHLVFVLQGLEAGLVVRFAPERILPRPSGLSERERERARESERERDKERERAREICRIKARQNPGECKRARSSASWPQSPALASPSQRHTTAGRPQVSATSAGTSATSVRELQFSLFDRGCGRRLCPWNARLQLNDVVLQICVVAGDGGCDGPDRAGQGPPAG